MRVELLALFLLVGVGIYLMRLLPLLFALRRGAETATRGSSGGVLPLVGPSVVAALLVTSVLPEDSGAGYGAELVRNLIALIPTLVVAVRSGNLGLTVLVGILAYGLISLAV